MKTIAAEKAACEAAFAAHPEATWAWHLHHQTLCEPLSEPIANRIAYIASDKWGSEQALRYRRMRPVIGPLPKGLVKAYAAYGKALAAYDKALAAYDKAYAAYGKALAASDKARAAYDKAANGPALLALHATECGCNWTGDILDGAG